MRLARRPVPDDLKVRDLKDAERLMFECVLCRNEIGEQCYNVKLKLPADYLVARYVARHYCRRCSSGWRKVRPMGWIQDFPRSGAESGRQEGPYPW